MPPHPGFETGSDCVPADVALGVAAIVTVVGRLAIAQADARNARLAEE
jgi:hypothetical protein